MQNNSEILNLIIQILSYQDNIVTDNPSRQSINWTRRYQSLEIKNPYGNTVRIPPGSSFSIFNSAIPTALDGTSVLSLLQLSSENSIYRIQLLSGAGQFRTPRAVSGLAGCNVTINNGAVAVFDFTPAVISAVQPGDVMRIAGQVLYDTPPFQFNPMNAGLWQVLGVSGSQITVVRPVGQMFSGATENPAGPITNDVKFYSNDQVQAGYKFDLTGTFSQVSQRTYMVVDATPTTIDFCSTQPIPLEASLTYVPNTLTVYTDSKKLIYIECDQDAVVQFNADTSNNNRLTPVSPGDPLLPAFLNKWGDTYLCNVVNRSINTMKVKFFLGE
jgi:hypothetical protein